MSRGIEFNINDYLNKNKIELVEAKDSEWILFCWQFYRHIRWPKDPKKHCWNWKGPTSHGAGSYGRFHYKGQRFMAHRVSWEIHNGIINNKKSLQ